MYVYIAVSIGILVLQQFVYHKWTTASHTQRRYIVQSLLLLLQIFSFFFVCCRNQSQTNALSGVIHSQ